MKKTYKRVFELSEKGRGIKIHKGNFTRLISQRARTVGITATFGKTHYVKYYSVGYRTNYSLYVLSKAKSSPVLYLTVNIYQVTLEKREYLKWLKTP